MTEKEAHTKLCPFTLVADEGIAVHRPALFDERPRCIGTGCMAWRWISKAGTGEDGTPNYYSGKWKGYCGRVGKP
jgi:hypothetical protein